ncbi:heavy metal-associated isoprenylated plant protein 47-like [Magnolia sinica]|uniref:heavy metal-associated isoprenylated plant protein 47-like n=1 Tax=Magnolia sinica TaxID=86752 RepID=UPI002658F65B|nr:heavy metal-associated isoprenylated plant protein 47-like [Magnolia sinica]
MKQKIVMQVLMTCECCRRKAMKTASAVHGVISVVIEGKEQDQAVVIGEGVDAAKLACRMKKKVGHTVLITVEEVKPKEEKKVEKKDEKKEEPKICIPYWQPYPQYFVACEPVYDPCRGGCSLM